MFLIKLGFRNLGRHLRRSLIIGITVLSCTCILIVASGLVRAISVNLMENIRLIQTGDLQIREPVPGVLYGQGPEPVIVSLEYWFSIDDNLLDRLTGLKGVKTAAPRINMTGSLMANGKSVLRTALFGLYPEREREISRLLPVVEGRFLKSDMEEVYISSQMAAELDLNAGDTLTLMCRSIEGEDVAKEFSVSGIFSFTSPWQSFFVFIPLNILQELINTGDLVQEIKIFLTYPDKWPEIIKKVQKIIFTDIGHQMDVRPYTEVGRFYLGMLKGSRAVLFIMYAFLGIITGVGSMSMLITATYERKREIGIIRSMGSSSGYIASLFILENIFLTFLSSSIGVVTGFFACIMINVIHFEPASSAYALMTGNKSVLAFPGFWGIILPYFVMNVIGLISSLYPARIAAKLDIVDILRDI